VAADRRPVPNYGLHRRADAADWQVLCATVGDQVVYALEASRRIMTRRASSRCPLQVADSGPALLTGGSCARWGCDPSPIRLTRSNVRGRLGRGTGAAFEVVSARQTTGRLEGAS
jgi:hypothetical protein